MEKVLAIQLRLIENTAANNRLLQDLERRVRSAVNPSSGNSGTRTVPPLVALQVAAATQAAGQLKVVQEKLNADLERIRVRNEADELRHQRRMEEIAVQGARRRAAAQPTLLGRLTNPNVREAGESLQQSGQAFDQYLTQPLLGIGRAAVKSALEIDVFRSRLTALEGSAEAANKRLDYLRKFALNAPGVTFQSAADQYALLKGTTDLLPASIERVIGSVGKLNAAFKLDSAPLFIRNLQQIFTQNFEVKDIREALGRVPIFNQLLERAFGSSDPEQLRKLKAAGKITAESFFKGLGDAINSDPRIGNIQENLAARFEKLSGRAQAALEPLGNAVLNVVAPVIERAVPLVESLGAAFAALPAPIQLTVVALGAATAALGPFLQIVGAAVQALQVAQIAKVAKDLTTLSGSIGGAAKAASAAEAAAVASAAGWAQFGAGITSAGKAATTAATATKAAATGFSVLNPWLLGIGALLLVLTSSTNAYASATEQAVQIVEKQSLTTSAQQGLLKNSIETLKQKELTTQQLSTAVALLDPSEQAYIQTLKSQEVQVQRTTQALLAKQEVESRAADAQRVKVIQGLIEAAESAQRLQAELKLLNDAYGKAEQGARQYGDSNEANLLGFELAATKGEEAKKAFQNVAGQLAQTKTESDQVQGSLLNIVKGLIAETGSADKAKEAIQRLALTKTITAQRAAIATAEINRLTQQTNAAGNTAGNAAGQLYNLAEAIKQAGLAGARSDIAKRVEQAVIAAQGNVQKAVKQLRDDGVDKAAGGLRKYEKAVKDTSTAIGLLEASAGAGAKAVNSISNNVAKLRLEVAALEAGGGKLFDLELDRERLSATKSQLLDILKLRRELEVRQGEGLPTTQGGRESELRLLNLDKRTREDILKLTEQQAEYEARITVELARRQSAAPTAEQRSALKLAEEANKQREEGIELTARWLTLQARLFISNSVNAKAAKDAASAVPLEAQERIVAAEKELKILQAVAAARLDDSNRQLEELALLKEAKAQLLKDEDATSKEIGQINARIAAGLISNETAVALYRAQATLQRLQDEQRTVAAIRDLEDQLAALRSGSGLEAVLNRAYEARLQAEKQTYEQLLVFREEDKKHFTQTEDFKRTVLERAEVSRRQAARQTSEEIIALQDEITHAAEGAADRYQLAYLRAVRNIQQEDEQANVRLIENQLKLARQTEVRYDRLNDRVVDLLASQKGLTEAFQDFRANAVQDTFDLLDQGAEKIAKRFGVLGDSVKQLIKDLLRLAATKVFQQVLGLTPQQAPQGAPGVNFGGLLQPGASRGGLLNFGGFNLGGGIGPGGTGTFSGAPVSFGGTNAGVGGVGGFRGLINQFTGLPIFRGAASAITAPFPTGGGVLPTITAQQAGIPTTLSTETALAKAAGANAAPSAFAGLGAAGLLAGGGLLGSLAGGQSKVGQLLGGLGGTLGAGALGASGLLGGSVAAGTGIAGSFGALAPLLTNPITAIVAGGLIGTALIVRAFANRDLKKLAETIKDVHQLNVPVKGEGLALLKNVKEIGQQQYGKKWLDQRADLVQQQTVIDLLTSYAVGTGQNSSPLVRNKRLADPFNDANNFVRRVNGGPIPGATLGRDYIPALLDGNEYVSAARTVQREGLANFAALNAGLARITPNGGSSGAEIAAIRVELRTMGQQVAAAISQNAAQLSRLRATSPRDVLSFGLNEDPNLLADALSKAQTSGNLYNFTDKLNQ